MSFPLVLNLIAPVYCFCSCAARVGWNSTGSSSLFLETKQNKTCTRPEISGSQLGLETDEVQHSHTVWMGMQIGLSLRSVGNASTHL